MDEKYAVTVRVNLEFSDTLLRRLHAVFGLVRRVLDETVVDIDSRVDENNLLKDGGLSFVQNNIYNRAVVADNVHGGFVVFTHENKSWDC
jgi:hypothetical protein